VTSQLLKAVTPKATKEIAALPAQVKKAAGSGNGKDALAAADSYFSLSQFPQAVEQYRLALSKGGIDAGRANARLGVALARSGDLASAQTALGQVTGNWTAIAGFWTLWAAHQDKKAG
jgi:Flp pilus assembly protein TadD